MADFGGTGEGDFVDIHVTGDRGAGGRAVAGQDVDHAVGESGFHDQFADAQGPSAESARRVSVTTVLPVASAGASFQACISSGKFHGMIWPDHAYRLMARIAEVVARRSEWFCPGLCRPSRRSSGSRRW